MKRRGLATALIVALICGIAAYLLFAGELVDAKHKNDHTSPIITNLRTEEITDSTAVVKWTTDEPADSDIKYGIAPKNNIQGPYDAALVTEHAIALSELESETTYAFCVESRDEHRNKAKECDTFTTTAATIPPEPVAGGLSSFTGAKVSGLTSPYARILVSFHKFPWGDTKKAEHRASGDGSFSFTIENINPGSYLTTVTTVDENEIESVRKNFFIKILKGTREHLAGIVMPPTLSLDREVVSWGDDILVRGSAIPKSGVLVEIKGETFETTAGKDGHYQLAINSAQFSPGKLSVRVRSTATSKYGSDYSDSKTITTTLTSVPQADLNQDGEITIKDFSIFMSDPQDLNNDGDVNATDVSIFLRAFTRIGQ